MTKSAVVSLVDVMADVERLKHTANIYNTEPYLYEVLTGCQCH